MLTAIGSGDLVAFEDDGKRVRGIVVGRPVAGTLKIDIPSKVRPAYRSAEDVELLVKSSYDIEAEDPAIPTTIAVILEGGLVDSVRASAPITVDVIDLDTFDECYGDVESLCHIEEDPAERQEHDALRARYESAQALQVEAWA